MTSWNKMARPGCCCPYVWNELLSILNMGESFWKCHFHNQDDIFPFNSFASEPTRCVILQLPVCVWRQRENRSSSDWRDTADAGKYLGYSLAGVDKPWRDLAQVPSTGCDLVLAFIHKMKRSYQSASLPQMYILMVTKMHTNVSNAVFMRFPQWRINFKFCFLSLSLFCFAAECCGRGAEEKFLRSVESDNWSAEPTSRPVRVQRKHRARHHRSTHQAGQLWLQETTQGEKPVWRTKSNRKTWWEKTTSAAQQTDGTAWQQSKSEAHWSHCAAVSINVFQVMFVGEEALDGGGVRKVI